MRLLERLHLLLVLAQVGQLGQQGTQHLGHLIAQPDVGLAPGHDMFDQRHDFFAPKVVRKPLKASETCESPERDESEFGWRWKSFLVPQPPSPYPTRAYPRPLLHEGHEALQ